MSDLIYQVTAQLNGTEMGQIAYQGLKSQMHSLNFQLFFKKTTTFNSMFSKSNKSTASNNNYHITQWTWVFGLHSDLNWVIILRQIKLFLPAALH